PAIAAQRQLDQRRCAEPVSGADLAVGEIRQAGDPGGRRRPNEWILVALGARREEKARCERVLRFTIVGEARDRAAARNVVTAPRRFGVCLQVSTREREVQRRDLLL